MTLFPSSRPALQVRVLPRFPARVVSEGGFLADVAGGVLTLGLDYPSLSDSLGIADPSRFTVAAYNLDTEEYEEVRLDQFPPNTPDFRTGHGDSNYSILNTDRYVALTAALTAPRTWSLPAANTVPGGREIVIEDEAGGVGSTNTLTITPTGANTINGASSVILSAARVGIEFRSDGTSKWSFRLRGTNQIADSAVTTAKINDSAVTTTKINDNAVTSAKIADANVTTAKIADSNVTTAKITDSNVTTIKIADVNVTTAKIADANVTNAKLANMAAATLKGSVAGGVPADITLAQLRDSFLPNGAVVATVVGTYATNADLTTVIPADDTIPQNTEGTQIISVSITPKTTTNKLRVRFAASGATVSASNAMIAALFQDSIANALVAGLTWPTTAAFQGRIGFEYEFVPATTSSVTLNVRVGPGAGTMRLNGTGSGRYLGGAQLATLIVDEVKA